MEGEDTKMIPPQTNPMMTNPMLQQQLNPVDPRADIMRQMMIIMGGLGPNVPAQPAGQALTTSPTGPVNPMSAGGGFISPFMRR
jgi:hypothetical protein